MPAASPNPIIAARDLSRSFEAGRIRALQGVNLQIHEGEAVAIVGPSGSGKSTLLQLIGALDEPTAGEICFRGQPLRQLGDSARFRARMIGFVFQSFHLLPTLTAWENVQIPMFEMPWAVAERRQRARVLLEAVGLGERLHHLPAQLSGGERQRVAVARSLANEPALLLADEPTGNLDSVSAARILELLEQIHRDRHMTVIVVTHDPAVAAMAPRAVRLRDGRVLEDSRA